MHGRLIGDWGKREHHSRMNDVVDYSFHARRVRGGGLRVAVAGPRSLENTIAYWEAILVQVLEERPQWLLVVDDLQGPELSPSDWCALVDAMAGRGLEGVRIAHVKPSGLAQIEYCELCAREAGFDARAFTDLAEAERWLRYGDTEASQATASAAATPFSSRPR
jgi:hypothetical protein